MRFYIRFLLVILFAVLIGGTTYSEESGYFENFQTKYDGPAFGAGPMFSLDVDTDTYLGQRRRRRGGGGRVWTNMYYSDTTLEPKREDYKIKPDVYGIQIGFDVVQEHGVYSSFFGNFNQSDMKIGSFASSRNNNYFFGFGKFVYLAGCHFGFLAGAGYDEYKARVENVEGQYKGNGLQTNIFGEFGVDLIFGQWAIKPFYALQYDFLYHGRIGSKEDVFKGDWNGHSVNQLFGLRINWKPIDMMEIQLRTTWVHEMLNNTPPFYHSRFSAIHGTVTPAVYFYEGNIGRDWAWLGFGLKFEAVYNILLYLDYDCMINGRQTTHLGNLGLCFGW